jgi:hypothetical protein
MKKIIAIGIFLSTLLSANGQIEKDSIQISNNFGSFKYKDKKISYYELFTIVKTNQDAYKELKTARNKLFLGILYSSMAGALITTIGNEYGNSNTKWILIGGGVSLIAVIPFTIAFNKRTKNAVAIYNNGLNQ